MNDNGKVEQELVRQREDLLHRLQDWLELPMLLLSITWLVLFILEILWGLVPILLIAGYVIWVIFIIDFLLKFTLAPHKVAFLKNNWLGIIALLIPALRVFRVVGLLRLARVTRTAGAIRSLRILRLLTSINRAIKTLGRNMERRGVGYILLLTLLVTFAGAAGIYSFEGRDPDGELADYGTALWWTAMMMTTMGSQFWPKTPEGRVLCFFLALYGFTMFGYVTATLASFFIGQDAEDDEAEVAGTLSISLLREDIAGLTREVAELRARLGHGSD